MGYPFLSVKMKDDGSSQKLYSYRTQISLVTYQAVHLAVPHTFNGINQIIFHIMIKNIKIFMDCKFYNIQNKVKTNLKNTSMSRREHLLSLVFLDVFIRKRDNERYN